MKVPEITKTDNRKKSDKSNTKPLIALYETGKTLREVGRFYNISGERVRQIFESIDYKTREYTSTERRKKELVEAGKKRRKVLPEAELKRLYLEEKLKLSKIAQLLGSNMGTVRANLMRYGIPMRSREESLKLFSRKPDLTKEKLYQLYIVEDKSQSEIGKMFGYSRINIAKLAARYGIRKITGAPYERVYGRFAKQHGTDE